MDEDLIRLGLVDEEDIALDDAALSLASLDHSGADLRAYDELLEAVAARLEIVGNGAATGWAQADALAHVLGGEFGFVGDRETYDDPANADLISVLDRRRGLPVSLSILYVATARRVGWTADVLDIPGHVLVRVGGDEDGYEDAVIVDPFRGGVAVTRDELAAMLGAAADGAELSVDRIAAMPNRAVLVRLLLNQALRAEATGKGRRALELYRRMTIMAPAHGHAWWDCARLELVDGNVPAARRSLTAMLEVTRDPKLRKRVSGVLGSLATT